MPGSRVPGSICLSRSQFVLDDGTFCLTQSLAARPIGAGEDPVANWSVGDKLLAAAQRTTPRLPLEMRDQFAQLFAPENLAITAGVLTAWGVSHLFGVGEIADGVLLIGGVLVLGWQAFEAGQEIGRFLSIAASAQTDADLDRAAEHLARAVVILGITAFIALILKYGRKLSRSAATAARDEYWGLSVREWLARIGKSKAPPLVERRLAQALRFLRERFPGKNAKSIEGYVKGMDLSREVQLVTLEVGTEVIAYGDPNRLGMFYTKVGTGMQRLGIDSGSRQFMRFRLTSRVTALESRASGVADTWTTPGSKALAEGGGLQYIIPDATQVLQAVK